jgi:hypothetical protein
MNCSGEHAAMLLTCAVNGWSTDDYLDVNHPLQRHVRVTMAEAAGDPMLHDAIDGCGAPLFRTTVRGIATAFRGIPLTVTQGQPCRGKELARTTDRRTLTGTETMGRIRLGTGGHRRPLRSTRRRAPHNPSVQHATPHHGPA